jgi:hypothetical protein
MALAEGWHKRLRKVLQRMHPAKIAVLLEHLGATQRPGACGSCHPYHGDRRCRLLRFFGPRYRVPDMTLNFHPIHLLAGFWHDLQHQFQNNDVKCQSVSIDP